jgi:hypothetical protein
MPSVLLRVDIAAFPIRAHRTRACSACCHAVSTGLAIGVVLLLIVSSPLRAADMIDAEAANELTKVVLEIYVRLAP